MASNRGYSVSLVEPHPSAPYIHTARGGAGNIARASPNKAAKTTSAPTSPSTTTRTTHVAPKSSNRMFASGRGGAGNIHHSSERAIFSFDEELERQLRQQKDLAPVYHVGRGGAGNMVYIDGSVRSTRKASSESGSQRSASSDGDDSIDCVADRVPGTVKRGIERGWKKVVGVGNYMTG